MSWQSVGTHTFVPTDKAVQVGSFDLAAGQDTIWVKITQLNNPGDWPWSYGILSWRNANGTPLGSIKAYSNRLGEVFRLGNGLPPSNGTGSIWFEPRGFNLGWIKAGFPWQLQFEAQAGASDLTSGYWNRDPINNALSPKVAGDDVVLGDGDLSATNGNFDLAFRHSTYSSGYGFQSNINTSAQSCATTVNAGVANASNTNRQPFKVVYSDGVDSNNKFAVQSNGTVRIGGTISNTADASNPNIELRPDGSATYAGKITASNVTFRSSVTRSQELDLLEELVRLEALVKHLYETLRLTPPAGWDVWDGNTDLLQSRGKKNGHI